MSPLGIALGALFFAASLAPSLIPRGAVVQGVLAGASFTAGYALAVLAVGLWRYLEFAAPREALRRPLLRLAAAAAAVVMAAFVVMSADWHDTARRALGLDPLPGGQAALMAAVAAATAMVLFGLGRLFSALMRRLSARLEPLAPPRVARLVGFAAVAALFWSIGDGVLLRSALRAVDASQQALDALIDPEIPAPADPMKVGSPASFVDWADLGRQGRAFIAGATPRADLAAFHGAGVVEPVRVYVGLNSAPDAEARAALALRELVRLGGFDRDVLVVGTPTGTGWMDPAAMAPLEYVHRGNVATVAIQYSYLQSYLSLLIEPDHSLAAGRALFRAIYGHWRALDPATRPRLYLYGLSLGAYSSQQSVRLHEIIGDPVHGALWVGPPFLSPQWRSITAERNPGSPAWLPEIGRGSIVRFSDGLTETGAGAPWGPLRIVYLQYASDPIVFFEKTAAFRRPDWMLPPRGAGVPDTFRWVPVVTFLQLLVDLAFAVETPMGTGHVYAYTDHVDPWISVTEPRGWNGAEVARLKAHLGR